MRGAAEVGRMVRKYSLLIGRASESREERRGGGER